MLAVINAGLYAMVPLALCAIGEVFNEKAGIVNIGLEGIMLLASFMAVVCAEFLGGWITGVIAGVLTGALIGLIHGVISIYGKGDQIISGVGINIFAVGFVAFGIMIVWGTPGARPIEWELNIPFIPSPLGHLSPLVIVAILLAILMHFVLHHTVLGLRVKAAGENPEAVDVAGINIETVRLFACVVGGAFAGLAGAYLSIGWLGHVSKMISAGRGFIALACVVFSGLEPLLALAAALIFGFCDGLRWWVAITPGVKEVVPFYFVLMTPYIVTLAVISIAIGRKRFPKASGIPYRRE